MNTITEIYRSSLTAENFLDASPFGRLQDILSNKMVWLMMSLILAVFISALSVVYVQDQNRMLFSELSSLQQKRDAMHVEWGQLLLEESTWSTQARIQRLASSDLQMHLPKQKNIIIIPN